MVKVFLKSFYAIALATILFVNIVFVFNLSQEVMYVPLGDTSTKVFGFTDLLNFIDSFDDDTFFVSLRGSVSAYSIYINDSLDEIVALFTGNIAVTSLESFFLAMGIFFNTISVLFASLFYPLYYIIYVLLSVTYFFGKIFIEMFMYGHTAYPFIYH